MILTFVSENSDKNTYVIKSDFIQKSQQFKQ